METKKFKINTSEKVNGKKRINAKSVLSKAGFTIGGAFAGAAFGSTTGNQPTQEQDLNASVEEENPQNTIAETQSQQQTAHTGNDPITEPQPIDNNHSSGNNSQNESDNELVDPKDVAESIAEEIDPDDIDMGSVINVDGYDYAYMPDGTQQMVFVGHDADGNQYAILDVDGDGLYGDIFDMDGNFLAEVPGVSMSDIIEMVDDSGDYIAAITEPWEIEDEPVPLAGDDGNEEVDEDELEDDILAQLEDEEEDDGDEDVDEALLTYEESEDDDIDDYDA